MTHKPIEISEGTTDIILRPVKDLRIGHLYKGNLRQENGLVITFEDEVFMRVHKGMLLLTNGVIQDIDYYTHIHNCQPINATLTIESVE